MPQTSQPTSRNGRHSPRHGKHSLSPSKRSCRARFLQSARQHLPQPWDLRFAPNKYRHPSPQTIERASLFELSSYSALRQCLDEPPVQTVTETSRTSCTRSVAHHLYPNLSFPRTVKLTKEDPLPGPQHQLPLLHKNQLTSPYHRSLGMRIGIPLRMPVRSAVRHQPVKHAFQVGGDIGIGVLVDHDPSSGVRNVHVANTLGYTSSSYNPLDRKRQVQQLSPPRRFDPQGFHRFLRPYR